MKIKFWGVRGSIASPGPNTVRYGGNTTCIEIRTDNNELIIIDAGTGIFPLSQTLLAEMPLTANVLITHSHWDHIQGLPFFAPNFIKSTPCFCVKSSTSIASAIETASLTISGALNPLSSTQFSPFGP